MVMAITPPKNGTAPRGPDQVTAYGLAVFALSFGLLISDYMARQVLNAVFPLLKTEWLLSDGQLGLLSGIVALMVGLLTFPLSLAADRWGRVRSLTLMAMLWSAATLLCGVATSYGQMLAGRVLVGVGEAAYGSVGIAVVLSVFPARLRATLTASFMAGGLFGQVLGVSIGGTIGAAYGWRTAFVGIALAGLALALVYPIVVREVRIKAFTPGSCSGVGTPAAKVPGGRTALRLGSLFGNASVRWCYLASGLQLYVVGAIPAWLPTYFYRYHGLPLGKASGLAAVFLMIIGAGMICCGHVSDRLALRRADAKIDFAIACCLTCATFIAIAFAMPPGLPQLIVLGAAIFFAAATTGTAGAMLANLTPLSIHGTAFATMTLANNLLGLAPGPILTGKLADSFGLLGALRCLPLACLFSAISFWAARRTYLIDIASRAAHRAPSE
jgi:MFS family permease